MNIINSQKTIENTKESKNIKISSTKYLKQFLMELIEVLCGLLIIFYFFIALKLNLMYSKHNTAIEKHKLLIVTIIFIIFMIVIFLKSFKYLFKYDKNYEYFNNFIKIFDLLNFERRKRKTKIDKIITIIFLFTIIIYYIIKLILN